MIKEGMDSVIARIQPKHTRAEILMASYNRTTLLLFGCLLISSCEKQHSGEIGKMNIEDSGDFGIRLVDVTSSAGLGEFRHENGARGDSWFPETMGAGAAFFDYDSDGFDDIALVQGSKWKGEANIPSAIKLYRNDQAGGFEDVTEKSGLSALLAYGMGLNTADYDNDGDQDIYFTTLNGNILFENNGGHFVDVTLESGLGKYDEWSSASIFFDADRDGHLDLWVGNYIDWTPENDIFCSRFQDEKTYCTPAVYKGVGSRYYRSNGDGTFEERTQQAGFASTPGKTLAAADFDFNRDGWTDLIVANDLQRDLLFENNGDGTFTEKGEVSGIAFDDNGRARAGMGIDTGIVDESGKSTVFVGHFTKEMIGVYRHMGNALFLERSAISKIGRPSLLKLTFGVALLDFELDGDLDLFAANGHIIPVIDKVENSISYRQSAQIYVNKGGGKFETADESEVGAIAKPLVARAISYSDYDRDGDIDVLLTENGGPVHLWRNDSESGNSFGIKLRGTQSNRDGLGSEIWVYSDSLAMMRRVRTGSSYLSTLTKEAIFGLGNRSEIDSVVVHWPSGRVDRMETLQTGVRLELIEGESGV